MDLHVWASGSTADARETQSRREKEILYYYITTAKEESVSQKDIKIIHRLLTV
jgi:hypothetical protein